MQLFYWVREWSESYDFPEVHIYQTREEAVQWMISEAFEAAENLEGWVTEVMDGPAIAKNEIGATKRVALASLNVQRDGGAVDCFRLNSQEVSLTI